MSNHIINLRRILYSSLLCASVNCSVDTSGINRNNLNFYIRQAAEQYLSTQGFNPYSIPDKLRPDYEQKIQDVMDALLNKLSYYPNKIDYAEVQVSVSQKMYPFAENLRTVVCDYAFESAVTQAISNYLLTKGLSQNQIKDRDIAEFVNRSGEVTNSLRRIMRNDGRNYVRSNEIDKAINDQMAAFVARIKATVTYPTPQQPVNSQASSTGWFDWLLGSDAGTSQQHISTPSNNKIMLYELETNVTNAVNNTLKTHNVDPNKIPARVVSDYSEKVQRTIRELKDVMNRSGRTFVWRDELEQSALSNMQPIIDKIYFRGEMCVVCQDNYTKGVRVGILSCGHHYHKDCFYQWLNRQKTCPMCRAQNVFVEKIETAG